MKVSALEIYNETVVDLLNRDTGPLRLLDDPEVCKGSETLNRMLKYVHYLGQIKNVVYLAERNHCRKSGGGNGRKQATLTAFNWHL